MYLGRIIESGPTEAVFDRPNHPYTAALMSAAPTLDGAQRTERILLKGEVPSPLEPAVGLPVPDPLLEGHRDLRDDRAAERARSRGRRTHRRVPPSPPGGGVHAGDGMSIWGYCIVAGTILLASALQASIGFGIGMLAAPIVALVDPRLIPGHADHGRDPRHADGGGSRTRGHRPARHRLGAGRPGARHHRRSAAAGDAAASGRCAILLAAVVLVGVALTSFGWIPVRATAQRRARRCHLGCARHRDVDRRTADGPGVAAQRAARGCAAR